MKIKQFLIDVDKMFPDVKQLSRIPIGNPYTTIYLIDIAQRFSEIYLLGLLLKPNIEFLILLA